MRARRGGRSVLLGILLAAGTLLAPGSAMAAPGDRLPDLRMALPNEFQPLTMADGKRLLRFSARIVNVGDGPLIIAGKRPCGTSDCPTMRTVQRIRQSDGGTRREPSDGIGRWSGDGHLHWHIQKFERYDMIPLDPEAGIDQVRGSKVGFCFLDTDPWDVSMPGAPQSRVFGIEGCGDSKADVRIRVGLSVGWADRYGWYLPRQYFDTTGLPRGRYLICNTADAEGHWLETKEDNNQSWVKVRFRPSRSEPIEIVGSGWSACADQLPPPPPAVGTWFLDWPEQEAIAYDPAREFRCVVEQEPGG